MGADASLQFNTESLFSQEMAGSVGALQTLSYTPPRNAAARHLGRLACTVVCRSSPVSGALARRLRERPR
jgi:hypothetical protein